MSIYNEKNFGKQKIRLKNRIFAFLFFYFSVTTQFAGKVFSHASLKPLGTYA